MTAIPSIALLQFRTIRVVRADEERNCREKVGELADIVAYNALERDCSKIPLDQYAGFIFGGSGELYVSDGGELVERARQHTEGLIREIVRTDTPSLFICLGLHLFADAYEVPFYQKGECKEVGTVAIVLTDAAMRDPLYRGVPKVFSAQTGHYDAIKRIPKGAQFLAQNPTCRVQAFRMGQHVYAVQFHPEMDLADVRFRLGYYPEYDATNATFAESPYTARIMKNFAALAREHYRSAVTHAPIEMR
ncbi:gamma-glutamyl-gamma-aminobutyrate hydrolase family protein [Candidatus Woesearchaeota archaeon]|nr:gamma-glutamyl-gamma-aminobutyrate hydrolase family protein [Candidatus Woesearchaeota archaeon]